MGEQQEACPVTGKDRGLMHVGCEHYRRRCKLVSPCCGDVFWCRHCHNKVKNDDEPDVTKRHTLDRYKVTEVVCAMCNTRQLVGITCNACGVEFGRYSCLVCNFFEDDTTKKQYHCKECGAQHLHNPCTRPTNSSAVTRAGLCRIGGRENFFHCAKCDCCYPNQMQHHACIAGSTRRDCPVCCKYLFDSMEEVMVLRCGHTLHADCWDQLVHQHHQYKCPLCSHCMFTPEEMLPVWQSLDEAVATTPMPPEYQDMQVDILCNDCGAHSSSPFHVVGHKCGSCGGYNTQRV